MAPLEAKRIIESLANGIDPGTGEILPPQSTLNCPPVIRALFIAGQALEKRAEQNKSLPGMAGRPWREEEDQALLAIFDAGAAVKDIAAKHGRTRGTVSAGSRSVPSSMSLAHHTHCDETQVFVSHPDHQPSRKKS